MPSTIDAGLAPLGNEVANALTHFWSNCCVGLADANFELIDCPVLSAVYAVLQIPPEKEIARRQVGRTSRPLDRTPPADPSISELGIEPRSHVQCVVCWCPILLEVEPPAHKIRPQKLGKHRQVSSCSDITIKKKGLIRSCEVIPHKTVTPCLLFGISICSSGFAYAQ